MNNSNIVNNKLNITIKYISSVLDNFDKIKHCPT